MVKILTPNVTQLFFEIYVSFDQDLRVFANYLNVFSIIPGIYWFPLISPKT